MQKKKHHNHQNYRCKIPGKKGNKYQVSFPEFMKHRSKKKKNIFSFKIIRNSDFDAHVS